jgi:hypothetical protein
MVSIGNKQNGFTHLEFIVGLIMAGLVWVFILAPLHSQYIEFQVKAEIKRQD